MKQKIRDEIISEFIDKFKNGDWCKNCRMLMMPPHISEGEFALLRDGELKRPIDSKDLLFVVCPYCAFCDTYYVELLESLNHKKCNRKD